MEGFAKNVNIWMKTLQGSKTHFILLILYHEHVLYIAFGILIWSFYPKINLLRIDRYQREM